MIALAGKWRFIDVAMATLSAQIYFAVTFHATGITNNHQAKPYGPLTRADRNNDRVIPLQLLRLNIEHSQPIDNAKVNLTAHKGLQIKTQARSHLFKPLDKKLLTGSKIRFNYLIKLCEIKVRYMVAYLNLNRIFN